MNIFLAMLGVALCVAAISMINFQREERRITEQNHRKVEEMKKDATMMKVMEELWELQRELNQIGMGADKGDLGRKNEQ